MYIIGTNCKNGVEVIVSPVDHSADIARLCDTVKQLTSKITDDCDSGYSEDGSFQMCPHGSLCPNIQMDDNVTAPGYYCAAEQAHRCELQRQNVQNRQAMIEFYWNTRGRSDSNEFLRDSGLVMAYWY